MSLFVVLSTSDSCLSSSWMQVKSRQLAAGGMSGCRCDRPHSLCRCRPSARPHAQSIPIRGKVQFQVPSRVIHGEDLPRLMLKSISIQFQVLILYQYTQRQVCKSESVGSLGEWGLSAACLGCPWNPLSSLWSSSPNLQWRLQSPQMFSWPLYSKSVRKRHCGKDWLL